MPEEIKTERTYKVWVKAYRAILVKAGSVEDAIDRTHEELGFSNHGWEIDEANVDVELDTPHKIERAKAHGAEYLEDI